jgi:hypothetical protein
MVVIYTGKVLPSKLSTKIVCPDCRTYPWSFQVHKTVGPVIYHEFSSAPPNNLIFIVVLCYPPISKYIPVCFRFSAEVYVALCPLLCLLHAPPISSLLLSCC